MLDVLAQFHHANDNNVLDYLSGFSLWRRVAKHLQPGVIFSNQSNLAPTFLLALLCRDALRYCTTYHIKLEELFTPEVVHVEKRDDGRRQVCSLEMNMHQAGIAVRSASSACNKAASS